ncbi:hypothetical protein CR970_00465 [Candidatus Saccharibacteria bacterium]|nr:MAG: hypothetical protein CR970_00465 [Candidatus Saccharibacteria bacterium]
MGQHFNQRDGRSELQQRLDADLRAKAAARAEAESARPDGVDDSAYIKGTKTTSTLDWAWLLIFLVAAALFGYFVYMVVS